MVYAYNIKISDNIMEDDIGQLVCLNVPIARSGIQEYNEDEIEGNGSSKVVQIQRPWAVVKESAPTFEGKPFIKLHPGVDITVENIKDYTAGHAQNIRPNDETEMLYADIVVFDKETIELIKNKKMREISCGYFYEQENNIMTKIIGEHIALVPEGRAGNTKIIDNLSTRNSINEFLDVVKASELKKDDYIFWQLNEKVGKNFYNIVDLVKNDGGKILVFVSPINGNETTITDGTGYTIEPYFVLNENEEVKTIKKSKKTQDAKPDLDSKENEKVYVYALGDAKEGKIIGYFGIDENDKVGVVKEKTDAAIFSTRNWWDEITKEQVIDIGKDVGKKVYIIAIETDLYADK